MFFLFILGLIIDLVLARNLGQATFWLLIWGWIFSSYQGKIKRYGFLRLGFFLIGLWFGTNSFVTAFLLAPIAELFWRLVSFLRPEDNRQLKLNL